MRAIAGLGHWLRLHALYVPGGGDFDAGHRVFEGNVLTQDRTRFDRFTAQIDADPRLELGSPTFGWANQAVRAIDDALARATARTADGLSMRLATSA